ncbi:MAG: phosphate signaling complex protein PhoU [Candidatus Promineifilaceae bacterium]
MLRATFERELQNLQDRLLALGSEVEDNISDSVEVLRLGDSVGAERVIAADQEVNKKRIEIMIDALVLIATQQPMAGDMRLIAGIIEITGELERINDYAKGIGKIALMVGKSPAEELQSSMAYLPQMEEKTRQMLRRALEAASRRDAELARSIPPADDEVDALFNDFYRELVTSVAQRPELMDLANHLEWAGHNLERSADRVTNICEWVVYIVTGQYAEMDSELEAPPSPQ